MLPFPQIDRFELQAWPFHNMSRPQRISVEVRLGMWMKQSLLIAIQDMIQARRISKPEDTKVGIMSRRAHDGYGLRQHDLVP